MTVIMVLLTFAIFLTIDYVRGQKQLAKQPAAQSVLREMPARVVPSMVAGFQVPENVRFHAGHTWALNESQELVRVGIDDFASKLIGKIESISLPQRGRWVRQGQKIWTILRDGKSVDMVSPIEGTISDVNDAVVKDPELARKDPYGEGWLVTVKAPDSKLNFRNRSISSAQNRTASAFTAKPTTISSANLTMITSPQACFRRHAWAHRSNT